MFAWAALATTRACYNHLDEPAEPQLCLNDGIGMPGVGSVGVSLARDHLDDEVKLADLHLNTIAGSSESVRDPCHRRVRNVCGIIGRSSKCTGRGAI